MRPTFQTAYGTTSTVASTPSPALKASRRVEREQKYEPQRHHRREQRPGKRPGRRRDRTGRHGRPPSQAAGGGLVDGASLRRVGEHRRVGPLRHPPRRSGRRRRSVRGHHRERGRPSHRRAPRRRRTGCGCRSAADDEHGAAVEPAGVASATGPEGRHPWCRRRGSRSTVTPVEAGRRSCRRPRAPSLLAHAGSPVIGARRTPSARRARTTRPRRVWREPADRRP